MSGFLDPLDVTTEDGITWTVKQPMDYWTGPEGNRIQIIVPIGQTTDFGSVPQKLWWIISPIGPATRAFVLHDYLYTVQTFTRLRADAILLEAMAVLSVSWLERSIIWLGVRAGGWAAWNKHAKENLEKKAIGYGTPA